MLVRTREYTVSEMKPLKIFEQPRCYCSEILGSQIKYCYWSKEICSTSRRWFWHSPSKKICLQERKDLLETNLKKCSQNCWVGLCFSYEFYLHMWFLKYSKNFNQIVVMRRINQAFTLRPKTLVRLITIKIKLSSQSFYSKCWKKPNK